MPEQLGIDQEIRKLSRMAARILGLISTTVQVPRPALYQQVMRNVSELAQLWTEHLGTLSTVLSAISQEDPGKTPLCREVEASAELIGRRLTASSSAGWPRDSRIGMRSLQVRIREILGTLLKFLDYERTSVLPLVKQPESSSRAKQASSGA